MAALRTMSKNTLGAMAAVTGALCFSVNDATIKFLSSDFSLPQMMFLRSAIAIPVILLFFAPLAREKLSLRGGNTGLLAIRGVFMVLANMAFFLGLAVLPLAEATGVFFISPLVILALSVVFLKERAGPWRWGAVIVGLLGVLYMLRLDQIGFSGGFQIALLLPLSASVFYAIVHVITRSMGDHTNATTLAFYLQFCFFVIMGVLGFAFGGGSLEGQGGALFAFLLRPWFWPSAADVLPLLLIGCAVAGYNYFISQAYRIGEASYVAPLEYVALAMAVFWGVVVFGDWPDLRSWIGISLIVGAGLALVWRENVAAQRGNRKNHSEQ